MLKVRLFLNDPPGKRCSNIHLAATGLKGKYSFDLDFIKKKSKWSQSSKNFPKFPAVEIDGELVFEDLNVTYEQLEQAIIKRQPGCKSVGGCCSL